MSSLESRITDLEIRIAHQDAAIEELTQTLLRKERDLLMLQQQFQQMAMQLRAMANPDMAPAEAETPPPHY